MNNRFSHDNNSEFYGDKKVRKQTISEALIKRWTTLRSPSSLFFKVMYYVYYPFYLLFTFTLLTFNSNVSVIKTYLHFLLCILYYILLLFLVTVLSIDFVVNFCPRINIIGLLVGFLNISLAYYCYSFNNHNQKYLNVMILETANFQLPTILLLVTIGLYFFNYSNPSNNKTKNVVLFFSSFFVSVIPLFQSIWYKQKILFKSMFLNIASFTIYLVFLFIL